MEEPSSTTDWGALPSDILSAVLSLVLRQPAGAPAWPLRPLALQYFALVSTCLHWAEVVSGLPLEVEIYAAPPPCLAWLAGRPGGLRHLRLASSAASWAEQEVEARLLSQPRGQPVQLQELWRVVEGEQATAEVAAAAAGAGTGAGATPATVRQAQQAQQVQEQEQDQAPPALPTLRAFRAARSIGWSGEAEEVYPWVAAAAGHTLSYDGMVQELEGVRDHSSMQAPRPKTWALSSWPRLEVLHLEGPVNWYGDYCTLQASALSSLSCLRELRLSCFYSFDLSGLPPSVRRLRLQYEACLPSEHERLGIGVGLDMSCSMLSLPDTAKWAWGEDAGGSGAGAEAEAGKEAGAAAGVHAPQPQPVSKPACCSSRWIVIGGGHVKPSCLFFDVSLSRCSGLDELVVVKSQGWVAFSWEAVPRRCRRLVMHNGFRERKQRGVGLIGVPLRGVPPGQAQRLVRLYQKAMGVDPEEQEQAQEATAAAWLADLTQGQHLLEEVCLAVSSPPSPPDWWPDSPVLLVPVDPGPSSSSSSSGGSNGSSNGSNSQNHADGGSGSSTGAGEGGASAEAGGDAGASAGGSARFSGAESELCAYYSHLSTALLDEDYFPALPAHLPPSLLLEGPPGLDCRLLNLPQSSAEPGPEPEPGPELLLLALRRLPVLLPVPPGPPGGAPAEGM